MTKKQREAVVTSDPYRIPDADSYAVTISGMTSGWTQDGKTYLTQAEDFCACTRLIVDRLIRKVPYSKAELSDRYNFSSRMFNSAEVCAKGDFASLEETKVLALNQAKAKYWKAIGNYVDGYLYGMTLAQEEQRLSRIGKWRRRVEKHEANQECPRYFPGRQVFENQHLMGREAFQKAYAEARANRICSVGSWDEPTCCNSELQVRCDGYINNGLVTTGYRFILIHSRKELCTFKLPRTEGRQLLERLEQNRVPYCYEDAFRDVTAAERAKGTHGFDLEFIGPGKIAYPKKIREPYYVPLTVTLLRDKKKSSRWQVRVSWIEPGKKPYAVGSTFLSYDVNNDSLAYTLFRIKDGKLDVLFTHEPKFETKTDKGDDRLRLLHQDLNVMFDLAVKLQACIVGEDLRWEGAKYGFGAISKTLHDIPYATVRDAMVRKGLIQGVPVRFVNPAYTSILGGLFLDLNRDEAGALVSGIKGSRQGIELLEAMCQKLLTETLPNEGIRYKVEVKHRFSEIVKVVLDHQSDTPWETKASRDKNGATFTSKLSAVLADVTRHRKDVNRRAKPGQRLSSVVFLGAIGPTARPRHRHKGGSKVTENQELALQQ